jgi:putative transposase
MEEARENGIDKMNPIQGVLARELVAGGHPVSAVASALGLSRPHPSSRQRAAPRRRGRPPVPDQELVAATRVLMADLPSYGYRRVHALLRRQAEQEGRPAPNVKRV